MIKLIWAAFVMSMIPLLTGCSGCSDDDKNKATSQAEAWCKQNPGSPNCAQLWIQQHGGAAMASSGSGPQAVTPTTPVANTPTATPTPPAAEEPAKDRLPSPQSIQEMAKQVQAKIKALDE